MPSVLSRWIRRAFPKVPRAARRWSCCLERLEDRTVPAGNLLVTTAADYPQPYFFKEYTPGGTLVRSEWVDYFGQVEGEPVGIAILDHPENPRHPTYWHSRAYGLFAANIFGVHDFTNDKAADGSMSLSPGQSIRFQYRVIIHSGDYRTANVARLYQDYAAGKQPGAAG